MTPAKPEHLVEFIPHRSTHLDGRHKTKEIIRYFTVHCAGIRFEHIAALASELLGT